MSPPVFVALNIGGTAARLAAIRHFAVRTDCWWFRACSLPGIRVAVSTFTGHLVLLWGLGAGDRIFRPAGVVAGLCGGAQVRASGLDLPGGRDKFVADAHTTNSSLVIEASVRTCCPGVW